MPAYTTINQLQIPVGSDPPNVETATHPLAKGAERRCFNFVNNELELGDFLSDPTEGMIHYNDAHSESLLFIDGMWRAAAPTWQFLPSTVTVPSTSDVSVFTVDLQPNSIYRIEGTFIFNSPTDDVEWSLGGPASGWFYSFSRGMVSYTAPTIYPASAFNQGATIHAGVFPTDAGTSDSTLIVQARKTADVGVDASVLEGFLMVQRFGAWVGS